MHYFIFSYTWTCPDGKTKRTKARTKKVWKKLKKSFDKKAKILILGFAEVGKPKQVKIKQNRYKLLFKNRYTISRITYLLKCAEGTASVVTSDSRIILETRKRYI